MNYSTADLLTYLKTLPAKPKHQQAFSLKTSYLTVDLSRHYLNQRDLTHIGHWLEQRGFKQAIQALFEPNALNYTEQRSVDHVLLRQSPVDDKQHPWVQAFNQGHITGYNGQKITALLVLGIGGSHLGVQFVVDALQDYCRKDLDLYFLTGTDPDNLQDVLSKLQPASTLVFVSSKSWSTVETFSNLAYVKQWFIDHVGQEVFERMWAQQFLALTAHPAKAQADGFAEAHIFPFSEGIGGRFSLWSAIGLPMRLLLGEQHFQALLAGASDMDQHFKNQALAVNIPFLLALLDVYYGNCCQVQARAVVPYSQRLRLLVDHLQQLEMESNGKSINPQGQRIDYHTGLAVFGGVGPNCQHSFHQWFYQGTFGVPIDFLVIKRQSAYPNGDRLLIHQCLAQAKALWEGNQAQGSQQWVKGGQPSTVVILHGLTPHSIGQLIAVYEHKVFSLSLLTETNAFDQYGVELGKQQTQALSSPQASLDPITAQLLENFA